MAITVYQYKNCSTCRKALRWLDAHDVAHRTVDIVEKPPSAAVLKRVAKAANAPPRKLFNTSGQSYRNGGFKDRLGDMSEAEMFRALAADGKLIKRPLVFGDGVALVGFREAEYAEALG